MHIITAIVLINVEVRPLLVLEEIELVTGPAGLSGLRAELFRTPPFNRT